MELQTLLTSTFREFSANEKLELLGAILLVFDDYKTKRREYPVDSESMDQFTRLYRENIENPLVQKLFEKFHRQYQTESHLYDKELKRMKIENPCILSIFFRIVYCFLGATESIKYCLDLLELPCVLEEGGYVYQDANPTKFLPICMLIGRNLKYFTNQEIPIQNKDNIEFF